MSLTPEDDMAAAEYVLGTLDPAERAAIAARRAREPELDAALQAWEARLAPLAEAIPAAAAAPDLLPAIEARLDAAAQPGQRTPSSQSDNVVLLSARLRRWRLAAVGASAIAAALAIGLVISQVGSNRSPHEFVAILQKSPDSPAFMVSVNIDTREFVVRPVAASAPEGKSYELWIIQDKLGAPKSLGVIDAAGLTKSPRLNAYDPAIVEQATYAVTVEPQGGSPTGNPSGAPVFVGKLIPVGP